ncbi:MAG TPA: hypothetical protein VFT91_03685 [Dehalococcoidia bacterium]|nr:hypothetical protein [Dehalococcoidia bacterium]
MRQLLISAATALLLVAAVACGGGGSDVPAGVTPAITPPSPDVSLTPVGFPAGLEVQQFVGQTIVFSYPKDWQMWSKSYQSQRETVVLASVPAQDESAALPDGAVRIDFTGSPAEAPQTLEGEILQTMDIAGVRFSLRQGEDVPWLLTGGFKIGGIDFRYSARVAMNTAQPQLDIVRPILESWVIGSTNHHPLRSCISPGKCP